MRMNMDGFIYGGLYRDPGYPLGSPLSGLIGVNLPPDAFGESAGVRVEIPIGGYVVDLIRGESVSGGEVPGTVALLSAFEPLSLPFGSFHGPGGPDGPELRLILTVGEGVEIR